MTSGSYKNDNTGFDSFAKPDRGKSDRLVNILDAVLLERMILRNRWTKC
jgi:hypothetical protein